MRNLRQDEWVSNDNLSAHWTEHDLKKQSQFAGAKVNVTSCTKGEYENKAVLRLEKDKLKQSQFQDFSAPAEGVRREKVCRARRERSVGPPVH
jgi:hypothetical protein